MRRRALLASLAGAAAGVAGCLSRDRPGWTPRTDRTPASPTPSPSPSPAGPPSVSFVGHAVQRSAFYPRQPDFEVVWAPPDRQLLFAMVVVEGGEPTDLAFEDFSLHVGDRTVAEAEGVAGQDGETYYPQPDECDCDGTYETYTTYPLPAPLSADAGEVRWEGPEETSTWALPDGALDALAAPTTGWELLGFDAPDSVGPDERFRVAVEARNVGDAAGTFRGVLDQAGPVYGVADRWKTAVAPGQTLRRESEIGVLAEIEESVDEVRLRLRTVAGDVDHAVQVG